MAHPIVGLWKITIMVDDEETETVVQNYLPDGQVIIDAGTFVASGLWEATGERSVRSLGVRPIVTGTVMGRELHGFQEAWGEATVNEDDVLVAEGEYDAVDEDGRPRKGTIRTRGERVTLK